MLEEKFSKKERRQLWNEFKDVGLFPSELYNLIYEGISRGRLVNENEALFLRMKRANVLDVAPYFYKKRTDPLAQYREEFSDLTRGQLETANPAYYIFLQRHGLLNKIPLRKPKDYLAIYRKRFKGKTRGEVKNLAPSFYQCLLAHDLIKYVPKKK